MKKIYALSLLIVGSIGYHTANAQCNGRYLNDIYSNVDVTSNIQYGSNVDLDANNVNLMMDIYEPQGDTASKRPVVIFAHGGSFIGGSKTDPDIVYFCTELAKKGYVCASITYRLAGSAFDLLAEETTVKVVFNAIQDGKAAIRYFRKNAATTNTYKVDTNQIFIGGSSAGGILGINLTYMDDLNKLTPQWQTWANQIGGLEGNSGNPGHCSTSNGTFGFAGAVADTAWIDPNDAPWYGSHAQTDQTVKYGYGKPLNGTNPVNLYGSSLLTVRLNNLNIYNHFDSYSGGAHPPYSGSTSIRQDNKDSLTMFLHNILDCNPSNLKKPNQESCSISTAIADNIINNDEVKSIYPNPFTNNLTIELSNIENASVSIYNTMGQLIKAEKINTYLHQVNVTNLKQGAYFVRVNTNEGVYTETLIKQ